MYLRNSDIIKGYGISSGTASQWSNNAKEGKNNLTLVEVEGKQYIQDTPANHEELDRLYQLGRNKLKSDYKKEIIASKEFLSLFTDEQLIEFISDLGKYEINGKFGYFGNGANIWDKIYHEGNSRLQVLSLNVINKLMELLSVYLENKSYNVFDVGAGNGEPLFPFIHALNAKKQLNKYYSIDISKEMNELAKQNIEKEIGDNYGGYLTTDIEATTFSTYFYKNTPDSTNNIICFFGRTIGNISDRVRIFDNIAKGMTAKDLFVFNFSLDTKQNNQDLNKMKSNIQNELHSSLPELLGIEIDQKTFYTDFNPELNFKFKTFKATKEYQINFPVFNHTKKVHIPINTEITVWRAYTLDQKEIIDELDKAGLEVLSLTKDKTAQTAMIICRLK